MPEILTEAQRAQFEASFPLFFVPPPALPAGAAPRETAFNLRRFSAGANLPRGRYYGLIDSSLAPRSRALTSMHGMSSLVGELLTYADGSACAWTSAFDLSQVSSQPGMLTDEQRRAVDATHGHVIAVFDRPLVFDSRLDRTAHEQGYLFPYQVGTMTRERAFDLRRAETLDWLMNALNEDFPNVLFLPDIDPADPDSDIFYVKNAATPDKRQQLVDTVPHPVYRGLRGIGEELRGLGDLLRFLLTDSLGGTPLLDFISTYIVDCGADCIIYPSARVDCGVLVSRR